MRAFARAFVVAIAVGCAANATAQSLPASNDPRATFETPIFRLPVPASDKDVYTLILGLRDGTTKKIVLPQGSAGWVAAPNLLSQGVISWRYVLQTDQLSPLAVSTPDRRVSHAELIRYGDATALEWPHVEQAASYRLITRPDKAASHAIAPEWGDEVKTELSVAEQVHKGIGHYDLQLASGARVQWRVLALDADGRAFAQSEPRVVTVDGSSFSAATAAGFKLQRSDTLSAKDAGKPAVFGYSASQKDGKRSSAYFTEFAVLWTGPQLESYRAFYPKASLEARLHSTGSDKDTDALKFRAGGYRILEGIGEVTGNFKYEAESSKDTKKALLEMAFAPSFFPFAADLPRPTADRTAPSGNYRLGEAPAVQVMPNLTVGLDLGRTLKVGSSAETKKSLSRQWLDFRLDLQLNFLADALRIPGATLYGQTKRWHLSGQSPSTYHLSGAGLNFQMTKELSVDMSYVVGADAPAFKFNRTAVMGLGLKF
jgi:hypothetical protein